jgi:uncharacterized protein DUF1592/uncharacterized protein DUF1588/uncharacterized protein DUF1595/uncharacterized protein DUF1587/uncharacterized protein DUF1585
MSDGNMPTFTGRTRAPIHLRAARAAGGVSLLAMLALAACTSSDGNSQPASSGNNGSAGSSGSTGMGTAGTGQGAADPGLDPYAVPSAPPPAVFVQAPRLARLSRQQWSNTVRDLLKLTDIKDVDDNVAGDALIGFDNQADALYVTEQLRQQLADAAEKLADRVTGDATALASLMPVGAPTDGAARARAFVTSFGQRAFRRPLTDAEVTSHLALYDQGPTLYPGSDAFKAGVNLVIQAMLQSPHFLYRTELGAGTTAGAAKVPLNDYEVAAKLAFALTNTMPDDELFAAAAAGQLHDPAGVATQARRLMDGARGTAGVNNFNFQVYRLGTYDGIMRDPAVFPDFTPSAPSAMRQEALSFFDWIFTQGRGVKDFYTTPVGFVNSALAPLYGVAKPSGDALTKVDLDPSQRSGILTQPGFLSSYITGDDPDIIHRGVFIATRLLCLELPPPSPLATALVELQPNMTNRERVEMTTGKGTCGEACHMVLFNPLGNAFENYDAIGKYRTTDRNKPVNAADSYTLDGQLKSFSNAVELSRLLADAKQTHNCYVQNMMSYLHSRLLAPEEAPMVDYYARQSRAGLVSLHDLELDIVTSEAFLNRRP